MILGNIVTLAGAAAGAASMRSVNHSRGDPIISMIYLIGLVIFVGMIAYDLWKDHHS